MLKILHLISWHSSRYRSQNKHNKIVYLQKGGECTGWTGVQSKGDSHV
jgi:hypothetical protein